MFTFSQYGEIKVRPLYKIKNFNLPFVFVSNFNVSCIRVLNKNDQRFK